MELGATKGLFDTVNEASCSICPQFSFVLRFRRGSRAILFFFGFHVATVSPL